MDRVFIVQIDIENGKEFIPHSIYLPLIGTAPVKSIFCPVTAIEHPPINCKKVVNKTSCACLEFDI